MPKNQKKTPVTRIPGKKVTDAVRGKHEVDDVHLPHSMFHLQRTSHSHNVSRSHKSDERAMQEHFLSLDSSEKQFRYALRNIEKYLKVIREKPELNIVANAVKYCNGMLNVARSLGDYRIWMKYLELLDLCREKESKIRGAKLLPGRKGEVEIPPLQFEVCYIAKALDCLKCVDISGEDSEAAADKQHLLARVTTLFDTYGVTLNRVCIGFPALGVTKPVMDAFKEEHIKRLLAEKVAKMSITAGPTP